MAGLEARASPGKLVRDVDPCNSATRASAQPPGRSEGAELVGWLREALGKCRNSSVSVAKSRLTLCDPVNCSMPGFSVHHHLPEFPQTHVHRIGDAI